MSTESREPDESGVEEAEGDDPKVCQVCGDTATGYHFNAMTCEGCKGFFRRAMKGRPNFRCAFQNKCVITKSNRRQCQSCRLQKCLSIGMLKELIMSDKDVEKRRMLILKKRMAEEPIPLSQEQDVVIQELLSAHRKTFDTTFSNVSHFRPLDRDENPMSEYTERSSVAGQFGSSIPTMFHSVEAESIFGEEKTKFTTLGHVADLSTYMIQNIISFAKLLKSFRSLSIEDQIALLKGAAFEIIQMRFNMLFNEKTGIWECGSLQYCMNDAQRAGFQHHLLDPLMKFHYTLRRLHLHEEEYLLMQVMSLFSPDRLGVTQNTVIDKIQESIALTLVTYIESKRKGPKKHLLFPKIMACLTELRTMNEEYSKQVLQIQDIQPEVSPLMLEIVSSHC
ncbi:nuclear receptor subfamily 1 group I member 2 isoform X1 [Trichomycterus rosablanca]|uniref:nuclear receptor subfamily 1 group I member 2 isoform X1 n=2 Tax=Trichomycterus rosablanca TaxID=2290929 RepID=UPI002F35E049